MKVLLVGGSGMVGTFITPYLKEHHSLRVLDLQAPIAEGVEYVEGSMTDPEILEVALEGCDSFINLVMMRPQGGASTDQSLPLIISNYEVNTLGLHLLLYIAHGLGIRRGVHTSTMSVHYRGRTWYGQEEDVPLDTPSVYGLTKSLGEVICAYFARWFDMNLIALRITGPRPRARYLEERRNRPAGFEQTRALTEPVLFSPPTRKTWPQRTLRPSKRSRSVTAGTRPSLLPATRTRPTITCPRPGACWAGNQGRSATSNEPRRPYANGRVTS